jgi:hypothetical protein
MAIYELEGGHINFTPHVQGLVDTATFDVTGSIVVVADESTTVFLNITRDVARELAAALTEWAGVDEINVGEKVTLIDSSGRMDKRWTGLECAVIDKIDGEVVGMVRLHPLSPRPDGFGFSNFWWPEEDVVRAD